MQELSADADVELELVGLVRKELIRPETSTFAGDHAFRFRHLLIRDAAYDALPKELRAELHVRFADWLASHGNELIELDEILGYHLEQAARYRRELGHPDGKIERRAAVHLAAAGTKAAARSDLPAADNLLGRALELLPTDDPRRLPIVLERVVALEETGKSDQRAQLIAELENHDDPAARMHGTIARLLHLIRTDPHSVVEEARRVSEEALEVFAAADDELGLARAWFLLFWIEWLQSRAKPALSSLEQAIEHAERARAHTLAAAASVYLLGPLLYGPFTPAEVRARLEPLREAGGALATNTVLRVEAKILMGEGRFEEALEHHEKADAIVSDLGMTMLLVVMRQWPAELMLLQGRVTESVTLMRELVAALEDFGETSFRSTSLIRLGEALYRSGNAKEAEQRAIEGEELGAEEDIVNYARGRGLRAQIAADRGAHDEAHQLAREALEYAYKTDFPWVQALTHKDLAKTHATAGRTDEANAELQHAIERFESYGNIFEAEQTRLLQAAL